MNKNTESPSSSKYFKEIFNNAVENTMLLMNEQGIITRVNKAFTCCFGYQPDELIGKHFSLLFTAEDQADGKPEKELQKVLASGQASDNNYLVSKDKTVTWVSGESLLLENKEGKIEILKLIQNIHKQQEFANSLQQLNNFNEDILGAIEDLVFVLDKNKNIVKANRAFKALFNFNDPHDMNVDFFELITPYDAFGEIQQNIQKSIDTKKGFANMPIEIGVAADEKRMFDVSCTYMEQVQDENHILVVMHDITVHKRIEKEREDVIGFVAHELRNPLANLVLCNEIMSEALKTNS